MVGEDQVDPPREIVTVGVVPEGTVGAGGQYSSEFFEVMSHCAVSRAGSVAEPEATFVWDPPSGVLVMVPEMPEVAGRDCDGEGWRRVAFSRNHDGRVVAHRCQGDIDAVEDALDRALRAGRLQANGRLEMDRRRAQRGILTIGHLSFVDQHPIRPSRFLPKPCEEGVETAP